MWDAVFILYVVWSALLLYLVTVRAGAFDALRRGFLSFSRNELFLVLAIGWVFALSSRASPVLARRSRSRLRC